jgi:hypothetical protein
MINSWDISRNVLHVLQNSQTSDSLQIIKKKIKTYNLGKFTNMYFFKEDICFTYQFLEDQKLKQERSCEVLKKKLVLSDLTPDVRSYPVLR